MALSSGYGFETISQALLLGTETTIYTIPASTQVVNAFILIVNTSALAVAVTLHNRLLGVAASVTNRIVPAVSIPANSMQVPPFRISMAATDILSGFAATASVINVQLIGLRRT